jgi:hypothetical protein
MPQYRAFISVHITAKDDNAAIELADNYALSIRDNPGHLELLGEVAENSMTIARVVHEESRFRRQLPADWKP